MTAPSNKHIKKVALFGWDEIENKWKAIGAGDTGLKLDASKKIGGDETLNVNDFRTEEILGGMFVELQKLNLYLAHITDFHIENSDLTC